MKIGGWQKTTLLDFPGRLAAIIFTSGCNFRCPFCFNRDLVFNKLPLIPEEKIFSFLKRRRDLLDGVVITGGEPTLQEDLDIFLQKIKRLGYGIKLDTNGSRPERLGKLLGKKLLSYAAVDFKSSWEEYRQVTKTHGSIHRLAAKVQESIKLLMVSGVEFELRTTVVPGIHSEAGLKKMGEELLVLKVDKAPHFRGWFWQSFRAKTCLLPAFEKKAPYGKIEIEEFFRQTKKIFKKIIVR